ncbi:MAG: hypothetical protein GC145_17990 [Caulobacter sp.]|nr:hypothetical protein [Caulobacter sp.]
MVSRVAVAALGAASLAACAAHGVRSPFVQAPINKTSPAAEQIEAVLAHPGGFPTFASIPPLPADAPDPAVVKARVEDQQAEGQYTQRMAGPDTWTLNNSEAFARQARADAAAGGIHPPTDAEIAESEAFAKAMRARAKPPPRPR